MSPTLQAVVTFKVMRLSGICESESESDEIPALSLKDTSFKIHFVLLLIRKTMMAAANIGCVSVIAADCQTMLLKAAGMDAMSILSTTLRTMDPRHPAIWNSW